MASPDIRRLRLEQEESQSDEAETDSTEAAEEFSRATELGLLLPTIEEELEALSLTPKQENFMTQTQTDTYASKVIAAMVSAPSNTSTTMVDHPKRVTIAGGGAIPESGDMPGTSSLVIGRSQGRGKASGRVGPPIVQASSGQTSGTTTGTGTIVQSSGGTQAGGQASGSGQGSGQTGGGTPSTGQTGGNPLASNPPGGGGSGGGGGGGGGSGGSGNNPPAAGAAQAGALPVANRALKGHPPEVFDGNRTKARKFMKEFTLWKLCNLQNEALSVPFSRVALCLSYIKGPNVDDWVAYQTDDVYEKVYGGPGGRVAIHQPDDEALWNEFAQDFADAFADTASAEHAYAELTKLNLKGDEADNYIALFERLINRAGWDRLAHSSIEMFKKGLPCKMIFAILNRDQTPVTIGEWQQALRNEIQRKEMIHATLGNRGDNPMFKPQRKLEKMKQKGQRDPNAMDVDAARIGEEGKEQV